MADTSPRRVPPGLAFLAGVLVAVVLTLVWTAWSRSRGVAHHMDLRAAMPRAPDLPRPTHPPDAPRIPDAPIPTPR